MFVIHAVSTELDKISEMDREIHEQISTLRSTMQKRKILFEAYQTEHPATWIDDMINTVGKTSFDEVEIYV